MTSFNNTITLTQDKCLHGNLERTVHLHTCTLMFIYKDIRICYNLIPFKIIWHTVNISGNWYYYTITIC